MKTVEATTPKERGPGGDEHAGSETAVENKTAEVERRVPVRAGVTGMDRFVTFLVRLWISAGVVVTAILAVAAYGELRSTWDRQEDWDQRYGQVVDPETGKYLPTKIRRHGPPPDLSKYEEPSSFTPRDPGPRPKVDNLVWLIPVGAVALTLIGVFWIPWLFGKRR